MRKFGRNYQLSIQIGDAAQNTTEFIVVKPPFTIEFDITRNVLTSANVCSIRVYNLSERHRNQIRFNMMDGGLFRAVTLAAGYGDILPIIFHGNINQAWSVREGVNFITSIECYDGGYALENSVTDQTFPAKTQKTDVIEELMNDLLFVTPGAIGSYEGELSRAWSISGNTANILRKETGEGFFIDNGKAYALGDSECLHADMALIDAQSGLLGTPIRERTLLSFDMIFEPRLIVGQKIELRSGTDRNFNGIYKIVSLKHRGTISESICGDAITSVGMFYGTTALEVVNPL